MDRYASRLSFHLRGYATDLQIAVAGHIGALTVERPAAEPGTFASIPVPFPVLPTPGANEARRYLARYWRYPSRIRRRDADVLHVLDHSYAHVVDWWRKGPRVVTVHDLLPVLAVERGGSTLRERLRNGLLERVLRALRTADAWIAATEWLRDELASWLGKKGAKTVSPMNKGGSQTVAGVRVTMTHAVHSCGIQEDDGTIVYGGEACGYVIEMENGVKLYHAGDTNVFGDMHIIHELYAPEIALLPIGDLFTMSPREATYACRLLQPKHVIPMHFGTFPLLTGKPGELKKMVSDLGVEVVEMKPGQTVG